MLPPPATFLRFPLFFFFNDTATTEIYTLSLHDALPIFRLGPYLPAEFANLCRPRRRQLQRRRDRKSTRLNSSHSQNSYAVFCLKKKTGYLGLNSCCNITPLLPHRSPPARNTIDLQPA